MADDDQAAKKPEKEQGGGGGGWGGWGGFSSLSVFSDLQKAADEISRNAIAAAKGIAGEGGAGAGESESAEEEKEGEGEDETEEDKRRKAALNRLEDAGEESLFGQGLKVLDSSVESFASGAWSALGNAWKGGSELVHKLENSAVNLADTIQNHGLPGKVDSFVPSIIESGKSFTTKGMQVLERVGKETIELLITETGIDVENKPKESNQQADEEQFEEVSFDRCFYIYGGPDQLEELEALSNHHALLYNRRKAKLSSEQKSFYEGRLKQIQQLLGLGTEIDESAIDSDKGKNIETAVDGNSAETKTLRDSSVSKAADMAAGFTAALGGLAMSEIIQRTTDRIENVHSEGVYRLSELCSFAVSQLLVLGKSIISNANKLKSEDLEDNLKINWPEDCVLKAKIIRSKAQAMSDDAEAVSTSFLTGISDIIEAYIAAAQNASSDAQTSLLQNSVLEKANTISNFLRADQTTALSKIHDALKYLPYVILSTSMPTA